MEHLIELIDRCIPGSNDVLENVKPYIKEGKLPKNHFLLRAGSICEKIYFITKGVCVTYRDINGREEVTDIHLEGMLAGDYISFIKQKPSEYNIRALEDLEVEELSYGDIQFLYKTKPFLERAGRIFSEQVCCHVLTRLSFQNKSPELRYQRLVNENPQLLSRVPQYFIAYYLGMSPVGLSKMRKRLQKNVKGSTRGLL